MKTPLLICLAAALLLGCEKKPAAQLESSPSSEQSSAPAATPEPKITEAELQAFESGRSLGFDMGSDMAAAGNGLMAGRALEKVAAIQAKESGVDEEARGSWQRGFAVGYREGFNGDRKAFRPVSSGSL
jgi:flagellar biosynthesis/type III secretory pathway protein FliH